MSSEADLKFGVPQGSVLGPLLFTLYTTALSSMISELAISRRLYADDSQLYVSLSSRDFAAAHKMAYSHVWLLSSHGRGQIYWNWTPDKTEFLVIGIREWTTAQQIPLYVSHLAI